MNENKNIDPKLQEALKGIWDSLTDEQKEKAKACKSMDELTALAGKEGVELPDEVLDAIAGGYIYHWGIHSSLGWYGIDDYTGAPIYTTQYEGYAKQWAASTGNSLNEISKEEWDYLKEHPRQRPKSGC